MKKQSHVFKGHLLQTFNVNLGKYDSHEENAWGDMSFIHSFLSLIYVSSFIFQNNFLSSFPCFPEELALKRIYFFLSKNKIGEDWNWEIFINRLKALCFEMDPSTHL